MDVIRDVRGILACGAYVPWGRLELGAVRELFGRGGGRGERSVASYDEDATTMGVAAARNCLAPAVDRASVDELVFATATPPYLEKTNACAVHAALRLPASVGAADFGGATRSGIAALRAALRGAGTSLVVSADAAPGLPTSGVESYGGDGAAALLVGPAEGSNPLATFIGSGSATDELTDRWRLPGGRRTRVWEERFAEPIYVDLVRDAWARALEMAGIDAGAVDRAVIASTHRRGGARVRSWLADRGIDVADDLIGTVGFTGAAHAGLLLTAALEAAEPGETLALVSVADGADVLVFRSGEGVAEHQPAEPVTVQLEARRKIPYGTYLSWRGMVEVEPPNRPGPVRVSSSAAHRGREWKYGLVGSRDRSSGMVHLPPSRVSETGGAVDDMERWPVDGCLGTVASCTIDRLVYSPSPPVVFAVVDIDGGGRLPIELTDCDASEVEIGTRVAFTFRRFHGEDGIHNYFWKARPLVTATADRAVEA